jgi:hypothetical protein
MRDVHYSFHESPVPATYSNSWMNKLEYDPLPDTDERMKWNKLGMLDLPVNTFPNTGY